MAGGVLVGAVVGTAVVPVVGVGWAMGSGVGRSAAMGVTPSPWQPDKTERINSMSKIKVSKRLRFMGGLLTWTSQKRI
ncbi:hypothetical protein DC030_15380 [Enterococcus faecalis]|nr:hypothetical protein DC030_15380 [Enterococcus faecalis]